MSIRSKSGWGPYEFTRPAYDAQRDAEVGYSVWIEHKLVTGYQKGVYCLVTSARPMLEHEYWLKHRITADWPNSSAISFEALLFQQVNKICRMVENAVLDHSRSEMARRQEG